MGLLKVIGTIRPDQFWPKGKSEADASKIKITIDKNSFSFSEKEDGNFSGITLFDGAYIDSGRKKQKVIKRGNQVIVRLQGVDAPELKYTMYGPTPSKHPTRRGNLDEMDYQRLVNLVNSVEYRQPLAETSCIKLCELLEKAKAGREIPCEFFTRVNSPQEVCDRHARLVGDVFITIKNKPVNIGHWLVENGLAFPSFYNSMQADEIQAIMDAAQKGMEKKNSVLQQYRNFFGSFEEVPLYREPASDKMKHFKAADDRGFLMLPKIFRLWAKYNLYKQAGVIVGTFTQFSAAMPYRCYSLKDFLQRGEKAPSFPLSDLINIGRFEGQPGDIVFIESPSLLKSEKGNKIEKWA